MPGEGGAASLRRKRFGFKVPEERTTRPQRGKNCQECRLKNLSTQWHEGGGVSNYAPDFVWLGHAFFREDWVSNFAHPCPWKVASRCGVLEWDGLGPPYASSILLQGELEVGRGEAGDFVPVPNQLVRDLTDLPP